MRLRELRKQKRLRQNDIAEVINCSQAVYSRYENGERSPSMDTLKTLANFYGVTIDYLTGHDDLQEKPAAESAHSFQPVADQTEDDLIRQQILHELHALPLLGLRRVVGCWILPQLGGVGVAVHGLIHLIGIALHAITSVGFIVAQKKSRYLSRYWLLNAL